MRTIDLWEKFLGEYSGSSMNEMASAVIDQMGGVNADNLCTLNSVRSGEDGYCGFIYYDDCIDFWKRNRDIVIRNMDELAEDIGDKDAWTLIHGFNVFGNGKKDIDNRDLAMALYSDIDKCEDKFLISVLCWYALEEVAIRFSDFVYNEDVDLDKLDKFKVVVEKRVGVKNVQRNVPPVDTMCFSGYSTGYDDCERFRASKYKEFYNRLKSDPSIIVHKYFGDDLLVINNTNGESELYTFKTVDADEYDESKGNA